MNRILGATAEADLCIAAEVAPGSTYKACFRSLIAIITELRRSARQPIGVEVRYQGSEREKKILSDLIWLGSYPAKDDLEFLVGVGAILPRSSYTEEEIRNSPREVDARHVIRKLLADGDEPAAPALPEEAPKKIN